MKAIALLATLVVLAACGPATGGDYLSDGTYQGTDRNGAEYTLVKAGNQVKLNGAVTEPDDNRRDTAFVARFSPGHPRWDCRPTENGAAARCILHLSGASSAVQLSGLPTPTAGGSPSPAASGQITIDLLKEDE